MYRAERPNDRSRPLRHPRVPGLAYRPASVPRNPTGRHSAGFAALVCQNPADQSPRCHGTAQLHPPANAALTSRAPGRDPLATNLRCAPDPDPPARRETAANIRPPQPHGCHEPRSATDLGPPRRDQPPTATRHRPSLHQIPTRHEPQGRCGPPSAAAPRPLRALRPATNPGPLRPGSATSHDGTQSAAVPACAASRPAAYRMTAANIRRCSPTAATSPGTGRRPWPTAWRDLPRAAGRRRSGLRRTLIRCTPRNRCEHRPPQSHHGRRDPLRISVRLGPDLPLASGSMADLRPPRARSVVGPGLRRL